MRLISRIICELCCYWSIPWGAFVSAVCNLQSDGASVAKASAFLMRRNLDLNDAVALSDAPCNCKQSSSSVGQVKILARHSIGN